ncbi:TIGR03086 family metal-binding protein [Nocardia rosealba]|uniref:TIGR03086 family metal-binding protein n=1 Tax=Nocardia rosealba TaxID=2878563 RepID=UPI001CD966D9|nr:TIGR03086 family metal-binding protein [Nocardia rosealba]MCA2205765.1 TIGR03086 family protein [Nocardia rosealba]
MEPQFDFAPAARSLATVVAGITDDDFTARTPCVGLDVRDLLRHVVELTEAFRQAATKESVGRSTPPGVVDDELAADWRTRIPTQLDALVEAWRVPEAWDGETEAGGVVMPAAAMAVVALDELVVHGWDLAVSTGQVLEVDPGHLGILLEFLGETDPEGTPGLFGPVVAVAEDAPALDRVLGLTGRDAGWKTPA